MKVNKFTVNLHSAQTTSGIINTKYSSYMDVFTNGKKDIIYFLHNNQTNTSEGEFSASRDNFAGGFYLPKNADDYKKALSSFKSGAWPKGSVFGVFMENFVEEDYFKDNNFPMNFRPHGDEDYIISCLEINELPIQICYYDDFVFEDGFHAYISECLYSAIGFDLNSFKKLLKNSKFRVDFLWDELEIDKHWNCNDDKEINILSQKSQNEDKTFKQVIIDGFKRLKLVSSGRTLSKRVNEVKKTVATLKEIEKDKAVKIEASNAAYHERNKNEVFLTKQDKKTVTLSEMETKVREQASTLLVEKLHHKVYGKFLFITFRKYIDHITSLLLKPSSGIVDTDFCMRALKLMYNQTDKKHGSTLNLNALDPAEAVIKISLDLGLKEDRLNCLLSLPLRTSLQTIDYILEK